MTAALIVGNPRSLVRLALVLLDLFIVWHVLRIVATTLAGVVS